jgi:hypothetical protein
MQIAVNWDALDDAPRRVLRAYMDRSAADPPRAAVWPLVPVVGRRCLVEAVPKAGTAREGFLDDRRRSAFRAQEKLNGVWVLWDGHRLWTKAGNEVRAPPGFLALLPPSVALLGELYLGGGHDPFQYASELSRNTRPERHRLPEGSYAEAARGHIWQHARIVAFDAPGLGEDVPYAERYNALVLLVGAWSARVRNVVPHASLLPLQLIRQYPVDRLAEMFREVVEGTAWSERRFPGFGVPAGAYDARGVYRPRAEAPWILDAEHPLYGNADAAVSGEGLMLWDQTGRWVPRGAGSRRTPYVLKYKPRCMTTGWVTRPPYHTHHQQPGADDAGGRDDEFVGYRVELRWWDPITAQWAVIRPVVPPHLDARRVAALFPVDQRVFFAFVWYDRGPRFMHAVGPVLSHWDAQRIQRGAEAAADPAEALERVPALEDLRDASRWEEGRIRPLFPSQFAWDHRRFCERSRGQRLIAPSAALAPPAGWDHRDAGRLQAVVDRQWAEVARRRARGLAAVERAFDRTLADWLVRGARFDRRFALHACACVAAWSARSGLQGTEWWSPAGADRTPAAGVALPSRWGPFVVEPDARPEAQWLNGMAYALVAAVAAMWMHVGDRFETTDGPPVDTVRVDRMLRQLEEQVAPFWTLEVEPRWRSLRHLFYPDTSDGVLFDHRAPDTLRPAHVAQFLLDEIPSAVWLVAWGSRNAPHLAEVPDRIPVSVAAIHDAWMDRSHALAPLYQTMRATVRREQWRPAYRDVRVRRDTQLPLYDNPRPLAEVAAVLDPPDAYTVARRALERALLNA